MSTIWERHRQLVNTDPERRCYNGCHFSSEWQWTPWQPLEEDLLDAEARVDFWRSLNEYAVQERGQSALTQYEVRA